MSTDDTDSKHSETSDHDCIIRRGRLAIMICKNKDTLNVESDFETYYVQLTSNCLLKIRNIGKKEKAKSRKFVIKQCGFMDDDACLFRLGAANANASAKDVTTCPIELICRCKDQFIRNDWLIAIESCLRHKMTQIFDEVDTLRGYMEVCFLEKQVKVEDANVIFKGCFCFYHKKVFRVKDFDPQRTLSYKVKDITYMIEKRPLCFLVRTNHTSILCRTDNVDTHLLWSTYILNDLSENSHKGSVFGEFTGLLLIKTETSPDYKKMFCKYSISTGMLDISDLCGISEFLKVMRCVVQPPKPDLKYHFSLLTQLKISGYYKDNYLYCRAATKEDAEAWITVFSPPIENVIELLKLIVAEIEIRRTFKHEYWSSSSSYEPLTYDEINDLILHVENAKVIIRDVIKCPVMALEKAVRSIFKFFPSPVIPFDLQGVFLEMGRQLKKNKTRALEKCKIMDVFVKLPRESQEIMRILSGHVARVIAHNKDKCPEITTEEAEILVWTRLSTNLCKIYEQNLSDREREDFLDSIGHVLPVMMGKAEHVGNDDGTMSGSKKSGCKPL